ncbi:hypothetical protein RJ035_002185 [Blastomyces gilchristii]
MVLFAPETVVGIGIEIWTGTEKHQAEATVSGHHDRLRDYHVADVHVLVESASGEGIENEKRMQETGYIYVYSAGREKGSVTGIWTSVYSCSGPCAPWREEVVWRIERGIVAYPCVVCEAGEFVSATRTEGFVAFLYLSEAEGTGSVSSLSTCRGRRWPVRDGEG